MRIKGLLQRGLHPLLCDAKLKGYVILIYIVGTDIGMQDIAPKLMFSMEILTQPFGVKASMEFSRYTSRTKI